MLKLPTFVHHWILIRDLHFTRSLEGESTANDGRHKSTFLKKFHVFGSQHSTGVSTENMFYQQLEVSSSHFIAMMSHFVCLPRPMVSLKQVTLRKKQ